MNKKNNLYFKLVYTFFKIIYLLSSKISYKIAFFLRYLFYRLFALDSKDRLEYYDISENAFIDATEKEMTKIKYNVNTKKIMIIGAFYHSNSFSLNLMLQSSFLLDKYDITMCESILDENNCQEIIEKTGFNYRKLYVNRYKNIIDKIFKDTFDYIELANYIKINDIDFIIMANDHTQRFTANKFLSLLSTKSLIFTFGNLFLAHPKAKLQSKVQLPKSYSIKNNKLISYKSNYSFFNYTFFPDLFFYDPRDIDIDYKIRERKKNIIFTHGRLSLIEQFEFLNAVSEILKKDKKRTFYFMGIDDTGSSLTNIMNFFKDKQLENRIKYLGYFSFSKENSTTITDKNWDKCKMFLKKSSIYLNTFPMGMGSSRMEAFMLGLPVVDLEDPILQHAKLESVSKILATAKNIDDYISIADSIFKDKDLSKQIVLEQYKIIEKFCDGILFWKKVDNVIENKDNYK